MNPRKEFFKVGLDEVEPSQRNRGEAQFTKLAEAREYRETLAIRDQNRNDAPAVERSPASLPLPGELFPVRRAAGE